MFLLRKVYLVCWHLLDKMNMAWLCLMPCVGVLTCGKIYTPFGINDLAPRRGLSLCLPCSYPTGCCSCLIIRVVGVCRQLSVSLPTWNPPFYLRQPRVHGAPTIQTTDHAFLLISYNFKGFPGSSIITHMRRMQTIVFKCTYLVDSTEDCYREVSVTLFYPLLLSHLWGGPKQTPHTYMWSTGGGSVIWIYVCVCMCPGLGKWSIWVIWPILSLWC